MEIVIYITISILILDIALIKQRMLANIETSNPYHAQYCSYPAIVDTRLSE
ncbi:hypothetical protein LLF03_14355 [Escherichia coli]|nr:hypothetical protein [Escherichia coli]MCJ2782228.1 hypothetical protein [Escherichia coli]